MVRWVVVGLVLLFSFAARADVSWQLFKSEAVELPFGDSISPMYQYNPSLTKNWIRIDYSGCEAIAYKLDVRPSPGAAIVTVYPEDGVFKTPGPTIYQYTVYARQTQATKLRCNTNVWLARGNVVQTGAFALIGTIPFTGGSAATALAVSSQDRVTHVRIERPNFCTDVEVRGVDFVTNGIPYPAKVSDKTQNIFEIDGGHGARITHVQVLIAGPANSTCQLGVYIKTAK